MAVEPTAPAKGMRSPNRAKAEWRIFENTEPGAIYGGQAD